MCWLVPNIKITTLIMKAGPIAYMEGLSVYCEEKAKIQIHKEACWMLNYKIFIFSFIKMGHFLSFLKINHIKLKIYCCISTILIKVQIQFYFQIKYFHHLWHSHLQLCLFYLLAGRNLIKQPPSSEVHCSMSISSRPIFYIRSCLGRHSTRIR